MVAQAAQFYTGFFAKGGGGGNVSVPYKCAAMKGGMNTCTTEL